MIAEALAAMFLDDEARTRAQDIHFLDAGHGYDAFGLHPSFVALGEVLVSLYDKYFRVRSFDHHNIPSNGPAVLAANHSGNLPMDGMLIWLDVLRNTTPPRVPRPIADHFVPSLPYLGTLFARGGLVGGSRGNARTLLDAGEMLMIFPEGVPGIVKSFTKRYQLQHFRRGHADLAIPTRPPLFPLVWWAVRSSFHHFSKAADWAACWACPRAHSVVPTPASSYYLYYGEPIPVHEEYTPEDADNPAVVNEVAERVKEAVNALIQRGLDERPGIFE